MFRAKWNMLTRWITLIGAGLRRFMAGSVQPTPEPAPQDARRGQVI